MVAPIRELGNITLSTSASHSTTNDMTPIQDNGIVVDLFDNLLGIGDKFDEMRGCSLALSAHRSRSPSMSLSECNKKYHVHVKRDSDRMEENEPVISVGSIQVEYTSQKGRNGQVSKVADNTNNTHHQHVSNKDPVLSLPSSNNVFNIQLSYDIDQALDPESWDGNFHAIFLHRSMERLASDVKNIKDSLYRIGRYIKGKSIIDSNANGIKDLDSVGKVVWKFLSAVYDSHWDSLYMDSSKMSFRNKVKSKFNLQVLKAPVNSKGKETIKLTYISPLPPPISAKMLKEVNEISKFFKKNNNPQKKSYA